jgi:hypothetical protein
MRLRLFGFSNPEDRFEKWLIQRHQKRVLEGSTSVPGPCPDSVFLRNLAKRSKDISLDDPRVSHAANCPLCMRQLFTLHEESRSRRLKLVSAVAVASCLLIAVLFFGLIHRERYMDDHMQSDMAATSETVDLSNAGTFRGNQPTPLQAVSLPAALVKVTIILPRYSESGQYAVSVTRDQRGSDLLARASGTTTSNKDRVEVAVVLDLRKSPPGSYFLSTTHEQDQASYYYPLQIK